MKAFTVLCCGKRRGLYPGDVLVCSNCDFNHDKATTMPNEGQAKDVPPGIGKWEVPRA